MKKKERRDWRERLENQEMRIPLLRVTKGSTDGTVRVGDRVYYAPDGSLCLSSGGFITRDELTDVVIVGGSEFFVKKNEE